MNEIDRLKIYGHPFNLKTGYMDGHTLADQLFINFDFKT